MWARRRAFPLHRTREWFGRAKNGAPTHTTSTLVALGPERVWAW